MTRRDRRPPAPGSAPGAPSARRTTSASPEAAHGPVAAQGPVASEEPVAAHEPTGAGAAQRHAQVREGATSPAEPAVPGFFRRVTAGVHGVVSWWQRSRPGRANARFGAVGGGVLSGGIAYAALFSLSAGLTLGWTIFVRVLGDNERLRRMVVATIDRSLPGLLVTGDGTGLLDPDDLVVTPGVTVAGAVAVVVLVVSATAAMAAMRKGVRAVFGEAVPAENAMVGKLRDLGGLVAIALVVLASAVVSVAVTGATQWLVGLLGVEGHAARQLLQVIGVLVAFALDVAVFVLVLLVLAGVRPRRRDLLAGAALAATALGVVRLLGTSVVAGSVTSNALLGSFAVLVTLLVWMNLVARIMLLVAAWTADPPQVELVTARPSHQEKTPGTTEPAPPPG